MKRTINNKVSIKPEGGSHSPNRERSDEIVFGGDARFMQEALGSFPHGTIALLGGRPGCGKSTAALISACAVSQTGKVLYLTTEMSKCRITDRLRQLISHKSKREQKQIEKSIHIVDDLGDVSYLPDFLLRRITSEAHTGAPYELIIVDSLNGGIPASATKVYKRIFDSFALLRSAGISLLGLTTSNKSGKMSGPNSMAHESCANLMLTVAANHRYLTVSKNRNGRALDQAICLEMTPCGRLIPSPHKGSMAASVRSFLPGDNPIAEIETAISLPPFGEMGRVLCPNLPRLQVSQMISSIERSSLGISLESFMVNIQLGGESLFRKSLHLPLAVGVVGSFCQKTVPDNFLWLGELDLNLRLRSLPENVHLALDTAIESDALAPGATVVVPASDAKTFSSDRRVRVVGVNDLHEAMTLIEPKKKVRNRSKRTSKDAAKSKPGAKRWAGGRGSSRSSSGAANRSKGQSGSRRSQRKSVTKSNK